MDANSGLVVLVYVFLILAIVSAQRNFNSLSRAFLRQERKLDAILRNMNLDWQSDVDPKVLELIKTGTKIEAIKAYKERSGASLKDAKDYIESLSERED